MIFPAFIFARGGSKGLPNKHLLKIRGKTLIEIAVDHCVASKCFDCVVVSTDDEKIAAVARAGGALVPFVRPASLGADNCPEMEAWRHALDWYTASVGSLPDFFVSVPATAPTRDPADICKCLDLYKTGEYDVVLTGSPAKRHPAFNLVKKTSGNVVKLLSDDGTSGISRRQDVGEAFDVQTCCYVVRPEFIYTNNSLFDGVVGMVEVAYRNSVDIDYYEDFVLARALLEESNT